MATDLIRRRRTDQLAGMSSPLALKDPLATRLVTELQQNTTQVAARLDALPAASSDADAIAKLGADIDQQLGVATRARYALTRRVTQHDDRLYAAEVQVARARNHVNTIVALPYWVTFRAFPSNSSAHGTPYSAYCKTGGVGRLYFYTTNSGCNGFAAADGVVFMDGLWSQATADLTLLDADNSTVWYDTKEYCIYLRVRVKPADGLLQDATLQVAERLIGAEWPVTWGYRYTGDYYTGGYEEYDVPLATVICDTDRYTWNLTNLRPGAAIHLAPERNRVPCWAKITSGTGTSHVGDLYENGPDVAATRTGVTIKIPQIATSASIPAGTALLVLRQGLTTYWGQPPVWL